MKEKEAVEFISNIFMSAYMEFSSVEGDFFTEKARRYVKNAAKRYSMAKFVGRKEPISFIGKTGVLYEISKNISSASLEGGTVLKWKLAFDGFGARRKTLIEAKNIINKGFNLLIHGEAGSGKTAMLHRIMLLSMSGMRIPVLIDLKEKGKNEILIVDWIVGCIVDKFDIRSLPKAKLLISNMLSDGKFILLCDGLEFVASGVSRELTEFSTKCKSHFVITCRTAYRQSLEGFTNLEITGFSEGEIKKFVNIWFKGKPQTAASFLEKMSSACYLSRKLCSVPLFLGMFCLVFDENIDFPISSAELCESVIVLLLKTWHGREGGSELYRHMPTKRKLDMFAKIAHRAFISGRCALNKDEVESEISAFLEKMPQRSKIKPDLYEFIRDIESQCILIKQGDKHHFSTLFIQEYLTARHILNSKILTEKMTAKLAEPVWREVFLVAAFMIPDGDELFESMMEFANSLFKDAEQMICSDKNIVQAKAPYPAASLRAFYISLNFYFLFPELYVCTCELAELMGLSRGINVDLSDELNISRTSKFVIVLNLDRELVFLVNELSVASVNYAALTALHGKNYTQYIDERLAICVNLALRLNEFELIAKIYALKRAIPTDKSTSEDWLRFKNGLRCAAFEYRNVCTGFEPQLAENIKPYIYANKVLAECMNLECCLSPEVREKYLETAVFIS